MATPTRTRVTLTGISSRAWEHPADRGALIALRRLKGFDAVIKAVAALVSDRAVRLSVLGSAVRVDERQFPRVHRLLMDAATTLDIATLPEVYVDNDPHPNAMTIGHDTPFIVLTSGLVDLLDDDELAFVIGHELGHVASGHAVYQTLLLRLLQLTVVFASIPLGGLGLRVIIAGLMEWFRKAELSADRAGLLATQDPAAALRTHMQLASGGHLSDLDPTSFLAQGAEYQAAGDLRDSFLKLMLLERRTHPFNVVRAAELRSWVDSGEYTTVLSGGYPRRSDDDTATVGEAAREAAKSYSESFARTQDALGKLVHEAAGWLGSVKGWIDDKLR